MNKTFIDRSSLRKWTKEESTFAAEKFRTEHHEAWHQLNEIDKKDGNYEGSRAIWELWNMLFGIYSNQNSSEIGELVTLIHNYRWSNPEHKG